MSVTGCKQIDADEIFLYNQTPNTLLQVNSDNQVVSIDYDLFNNPKFTGKMGLNLTNNTFNADADFEIDGTATAKMVLYTPNVSTTSELSIDFIKGSRTFGNDSTVDWRISNATDKTLTFTSGENAVITDVLKLGNTVSILKDTIIGGKITSNDMYINNLIASSLLIGVDSTKKLVNTNPLDLPLNNATISALALKSDKIYVDTALALKSDKTYVDTALSLKSDKTYVDTALALKSDKTYVDTALALKSDKTYVDTALALKSDKTYVDTALLNYYTNSSTYSKNEINNIILNYFTKSEVNVLLGNYPLSQYVSDNYVSKTEYAVTTGIIVALQTAVSGVQGAMTLAEAANSLFRDSTYAALNQIEDDVANVTTTATFASATTVIATSVASGLIATAIGEIATSYFNKTEVNTALSTKVDTATLTANYTTTENLNLSLANKVDTTALVDYATVDDLTNYYIKADVYNKTESDAKYALITSLTTTNTNLSNNYYNKTTSDGKYALITSLTTTNTNLSNNYYDKTTSDGKYALITSLSTTNTNLSNNYYTKTTSDGKYALIASPTFTGNVLADSRLVNNFHLLRSIVWKYPLNLQLAINNQPTTNPFTFTDSSINGIKCADGNYTPTVYMPAADGIAVPHGQPFYFVTNHSAASYPTTIMNIRTNMTSNLVANVNYSNYVYVFIYNSQTSLYEYQGYINNFNSLPTSNQFNSRGNSFTLPNSRGINTYILTTDGNGATSWSNPISLVINSATQTALDLKANLASPTFTGTVSGITKAMVGLGNVDNTADTAKPVSSATQSALDLKANLASPTFTGTVSGITKAMVGLGSVDNTADTAKPVSTATQTALNAKADLSGCTFTGNVSMAGLLYLVGTNGFIWNTTYLYLSILIGNTNKLSISSSQITANAPIVLGSNNISGTTANFTGTITTQDIILNSGFSDGTTANPVLCYIQPSTKYLSSYRFLDLPVQTSVTNQLNLKATLGSSNTFTSANTFTSDLIVSSATQNTNLINNYDLCRSLLRHFKPYLQWASDGISGNNPIGLYDSSVNGVIAFDGNWRSIVYLPAIGDVPTGQPYYYYNNATLSFTIMSVRTNMSSNLTINTGKLAIFCYNSDTSLYEYVAVINYNSIPTSNQFNSRASSFTLPTTRGSSGNIIQSDGAGNTSWSNTLQLNSLQGTSGGSVISLFTNTTSGTMNFGSLSMTGNINLTTGGNCTVSCNNFYIPSAVQTNGSYINNVLCGYKPFTNNIWAQAGSEYFGAIQNSITSAGGATGNSFMGTSSGSFVISNAGTMNYGAGLIFALNTAMTTWTGFKISNNGSVSSSSTRRIKKDITVLNEENILSRLSQVELVRYKLIDEAQSNPFSYGYIAEDLINHFPKQVNPDENGDPASIDYTKMSYMWLLGIQELIKENTELKTKVSILEERIINIESQPNISTDNTNLLNRIKRLEEFITYKFGEIFQ